MEILRTSHDLTPVEVYNLVMTPEAGRMRDHQGERVELSAWCIYMDGDHNGEVQKLLAVNTPDGQTLTTNSPTFIDDFERMVDLFISFGQTVPALIVISGKSKAGREFITCKYSA